MSVMRTLASTETHCFPSGACRRPHRRRGAAACGTNARHAGAPSRWRCRQETAPSRARPFTGTGQVRRNTEQPLNLFDEDPREGRDRAWAVSEEAAQSLRHGDHPLPHGHRGNDAVDEMHSCLCHPAAIAGGTDAAALAREGHDKALPARSTACPVTLLSISIRWRMRSRAGRSSPLSMSLGIRSAIVDRLHCEKTPPLRSACRATPLWFFHCLPGVRRNVMDSKRIARCLSGSV
jgi:hypothetical protein